MPLDTFTALEQVLTARIREHEIHIEKLKGYRALLQQCPKMAAVILWAAFDNVLPRELQAKVQKESR